MKINKELLGSMYPWVLSNQQHKMLTGNLQHTKAMEYRCSANTSYYWDLENTVMLTIHSLSIVRCFMSELD
jgi:hypothetical protein